VRERRVNRNVIVNADMYAYFMIRLNHDACFKGELVNEVEYDDDGWAVPQCPLAEAVAVRPSGHGGSGLFALKNFEVGDGESTNNKWNRICLCVGACVSVHESLCA